MDIVDAGIIHFETCEFKRSHMEEDLKIDAQETVENFVSDILQNFQTGKSLSCSTAERIEIDEMVRSEFYRVACHICTEIKDRHYDECRTAGLEFC